MGEFSDFALVPEQGVVPQMDQLDEGMQARIAQMAARLNIRDNAAVMAFGANMLLWLLDVVNSAVDLSIFAGAVDFISPYIRYEPFTLGQMSFASLAYYVLAIALFLFLTVRVLDKRRWSE